MRWGPPRLPASPGSTLRAFSLLEAMIAGSLFLLTVAGAVSTWRTVTALQDTQTRRGLGINLADDVLDDLRLRFRDADDLAVGQHQRCFRRDRVATACPEAAGYTVRWDVTAIPQQTFKRIDLVVKWRGVDGADHALPFVTYRPN